MTAQLQPDPQSPQLPEELKPEVAPQAPLPEAVVEGGRHFSRRSILGMALAALAASAIPSPASADTGAPRNDELETEQPATVDIEKAKELFAHEIEQLYPSAKNKGTMLALSGWFLVAVSRGFFPAGMRKSTSLNNNLVDQLGVFSPTSGVAMCAAEMGGRLPLLQSSSNQYDQENAKGESHEVYDNMYLVFLMSYLSHVAEQGIKLSPEVEDILQKKFPFFNKISGGWKLNENENRPNEDKGNEIWKLHMENAKDDMQNAATGLLEYSAATAILVLPTVYSTSSFSQDAERKYMLSSFEYFFAKAQLEGKKGADAEAYAMAESNRAYQEFFAFKLAFVDNILAGLGADGPCIPVFKGLFEKAGMNGVMNYFKMMVPNIMKWTALGLATLEMKTFGFQSNFAGLVTKGIGETIVNGLAINLQIMGDFIKKFWTTDGQIDVDAAYLDQILTRPPNGAQIEGDAAGEQAGANGEKLAAKIKEYMAGKGKIAFDFNFDMKGFIDELTGWLKEPLAHVAHPTVKVGEAPHASSALHQKTALANDLHAVMLERYQVIVEWDTHDIDKKRHIIQELLRDDPLIKELYKGSTADNLMEDANFERFISAHLSQAFRTDSEIFKKLLQNGEGSQKYPALSEADHAHVVRLAVRNFAKSLRMGNKTAKPGYHPDAGREVFGALSGQLIGAAIAASLAQWLLMEKVNLDEQTQSKMQEAFDKTLNGTGTEDGKVLLSFVDEVRDQQNTQRGAMSPKVFGELEKEKGVLSQTISEYSKLKNKPASQEEITAAMEQVIKTFSAIIAKIFQISRPQEMHGNLQKIYAVVAGMTPIADNIAAVLFGVAAGERTIKDVFGEEMLKMKIKVPVIPGVPLEAEMTVEELVTIMAAMIGINLGNGSLWGNGVQLGEKIKEIKAVKSKNIGDLEIEQIPATQRPGQFTLFTNKYAFGADAWTLVDVSVLLKKMTDQMLAATNSNTEAQAQPISAQTQPTDVTLDRRSAMARFFGRQAA